MEKKGQIADHWKKIIANSDSKAFEQFFYLMNTRCLRFCRQYIPDKGSAEEIVSDVFVDLWQNRHKLEHIHNPEAYMLICVKNKSLNHWKKSARMQLVSIDEETIEFADVYRPDDELERKELILQLDRAVNSLPLQCRIVFKLVKEDGMKCAEVAEVLNISVRTVHTQIYRAMNKLNAIMLHKETTSTAVVRHIASLISMFLFYFL